MRRVGLFGTALIGVSIFLAAIIILSFVRNTMVGVGK